MNFLCKISWHKWIFVKKCGIYRYSQCKRCKKRKSKKTVLLGWGPVDQDWLEYKKPDPGVDIHTIIDKFVEEIVISLAYDMYDVFEMGEVSYKGHTQIMRHYQDLPQNMSSLERKTIAISRFTRNKTVKLLKDIVGKDNIQCG